MMKHLFWPLSNSMAIQTFKLHNYKIFEKLILNKIGDLELLNNISLVGNQQHGFTKNESTATAGLVLQSLIARALDDDKYVQLVSLDLSAAFDIVNVPLRVIGLPNDVVYQQELLKHLFPMISFENIHLMNNRAPPEAILSYKLAIQLFELYNSLEHSHEWVLLSVNQILTSRQWHFK